MMTPDAMMHEDTVSLDIENILLVFFLSDFAKAMTQPATQNQSRQERKSNCISHGDDSNAPFQRQTNSSVSNNST